MTIADREEKAATGSPPIDQRALDAGAAFLGATADPGPLDVRGLAVAAAAMAGVHVPGAETIDDAVRRCIIVDGLTEKVEKLIINDDEASGQGATVQYEDGFYDEHGERIATVSGTAVVLQAKPHMWQFHQSTAQLADGSFRISGIVDVTAMTQSMTQVLQVTGTSGRYDGKAGFLTLSIADPQIRPPHYATAFVMC